LLLNAESNVIKTFLQNLTILNFYQSSHMRDGTFNQANRFFIKFISENDVLDYAFIDPPFGENLMYSELNFLWEPGWGYSPTTAQRRSSIKNKRKSWMTTRL
jgi:16S rRNA G966 N2-methylase RsmD